MGRDSEQRVQSSGCRFTVSIDNQRHDLAPNLPPGTNASISNAARYTAGSGAKVFAAGSVQFSWGLDSTNISVSRESRGIKQMIVNVLSSMGASPVTPAPDIVVP